MTDTAAAVAPQAPGPAPTREERGQTLDSLISSPPAGDIQAATQTSAAPEQPAQPQTLEEMAQELLEQQDPTAPPPNEYQAPVQPAPALPEAAPEQYSPEQIQSLVDQRVQQQLLAMYQQQQQQQQASPAEQRQMHERYMQELGMNPGDPVHRLAYEQGLRLEQQERQNEQRYQGLLQQMQGWQQQAQRISVEETVGRSVTNTLNAYGNVPEATRAAIRNRVAVAVMAGVPQQEAIKQELQGYLPLLQAMRGPVPPQARPQTPGMQRQLVAVATGGRTGGRPASPDMNIQQLESALFGAPRRR